MTNMNGKVEMIRKVEAPSVVLIEKLLVANRGEIAYRIIRSAKQMGIKTVAIYLESEKDSAYVALADESISLGNGGLVETFLNIQRMITIALSTKSAAIHPGYGFLSENADFAKSCEAHHLIFVGPDSEVLSLTGNKKKAKLLASSLNIPVIPGYEIETSASGSTTEIEFPIMLKAAYGGGGKGMQIIESTEELDIQIERSTRKARNYFGNGALFAERYLRNARHVEVQLLGDQHGNLVHLFERECSVQRNHQKIIEEAPAIFLTAEMRQKLVAAALLIGQALYYSGAGTVEFLVDEAGNYYFMEINPRIQVEHAVTEQITGIDIVREQLQIASGFPLSISQEQVIARGHAIEARIYAENPALGFTPSPLPLHSINLPTDEHLRIEADLLYNQSARDQFDPMLLKLITWGTDRTSALKLLSKSISELNIIGPENNSKYLEKILDHHLFQQDQLSVEFCSENHTELAQYAAQYSKPHELAVLISAALTKKYLTVHDEKTDDPWKYTGYWRLTNPTITISINNLLHPVIINVKNRLKPYFLLNGERIAFQIGADTGEKMEIMIDNQTFRLFYHLPKSGMMVIGWNNRQYRIDFPELSENKNGVKTNPLHIPLVANGEIISPFHGKVVEIFIKENQRIKRGDPMLLIEAMKSENRILSHMDALVKKIAVNVGAQVTDRMPLIFLEN